MSFLTKVLPSKKVGFLVETSRPYGGIKNPFRMVAGLNKLGKYRATLVSPEPYPHWAEPVLSYLQHDPFDPGLSRKFDLLVAAGFRLPKAFLNHTHKALIIHLMQGYELNLKEAQPHQEEILACYRAPFPRITNSPRLKELLEAKHPFKHIYSAGQGIDTHYFYQGSNAFNPQRAPLPIYIFGHFHSSVKQVKPALDAVKIARVKLPSLKVVRVSLYDCHVEEEAYLGAPIDYHIQLPPQKIGALYREAPGIFLAPNDPNEGLGIPPLEAMAAGMPVIATKIPSFLNYAPEPNFARFVEVGDSAGMAQAILDTVHQNSETKNQIKNGFEVVKKYQPEQFIQKTQEALDIIWHDRKRVRQDFANYTAQTGSP